MFCRCTPLVILLKRILYISASVLFLLLLSSILLTKSFNVLEVVLIDYRASFNRLFSMMFPMFTDRIMCLILLWLLRLLFLCISVFIGFSSVGFLSFAISITQEIIRVMDVFACAFNTFLFFGQELRTTDSKGT